MLQKSTNLDVRRLQELQSDLTAIEQVRAVNLNNPAVNARVRALRVRTEEALRRLGLEEADPTQPRSMRELHKEIDAYFGINDEPEVVADTEAVLVS